MAKRLKLPQPGKEHDIERESAMIRELEQTDRSNQKMDEDIIVVTRRLILRSPDGHYWSVKVDNAGALGTTDLGTKLE